MALQLEQSAMVVGSAAGVRQTIKPLALRTTRRRGKANGVLSTRAATGEGNRDSGSFGPLCSCPRGAGAALTSDWGLRPFTAVAGGPFCERENSWLTG